VAALLGAVFVPMAASQPTFSAVTALSAYKLATGVVSEVTLANPLPITGALTANQSVNLAQIVGTATVTGGLAGSQAVGGTAANNAAINQNPMLTALETVAIGTTPAAATAGNQRRLTGNTEGALFVQYGGAFQFSCFVEAVTVTTECKAAPAGGLRAYVTSISVSNEAGTAQTLDVIFGTGANCATAPTALTHKIQFGAAVGNQAYNLQNALVPTAANAICVRPLNATAFGATLTGYVAP